VKTGSKAISRAIAAGIAAVKAWQDKYFRERATHISIEVDRKHDTNQMTGWHIVHDAVNNPAVGTFNSKRFHDTYPEKV
jgi:hypothetical protein